MDIGNAMILFVVISSILGTAVFGVMHFQGYNIQDTKLQNKIIFVIAGPCLVILVSVMDVSVKARVVIFGVSALAGIAHLKFFDKLRAIINGTKSQDRGSEGDKHH